MSVDQTEQLAVRLLTMIKPGNCIAWIGSGLSKPAKYPGWVEIVEKLCRVCNTPYPAVNGPAEPNQLIDLAEQCKQANCTAYEGTMASEYGKPVVADRRAYFYLAQLPFKAYITTNYDPLLRDAVRAQRGKYCQYPVLHVPQIERDKTAFYIHGLARDVNNQPCGKNLVLAKSDFGKAYDDGGATANFIHSVLTTYPLVFIGCSLDEPAVNDCLNRIRRVHEQVMEAFPEAPIPQRMIFLARTLRTERQDGMIRQVRDADSELSENARYRSFGIEIVRYEMTEGDDHAEIENILERVLRMSGAPQPTGPILAL